MTLGEPLIRLLFEHGAFTAESAHLTQFALIFYAIGLAGHATVEIVDRVYYAAARYLDAGQGGLAGVHASIWCSG